MTKPILRSLAALALPCALAAQTFEVASVKAAGVPTGSFRVGIRGGPGHGDPTFITADNMTLASLLMTAYGVKAYQITGPDWLTRERFNITAKVPEGATEKDVNVMWQNLFKERFQVTLHRETKELPMFALIVGKGGPKMKETPPDDSSLTPPPPGVAGGGRGVGGGGAPSMAVGGMMAAARTSGPAGLGSGVGRGGGMMSSDHMQMGNLADMLSLQVARPVIDQTGLTGKYKVTLRWSGEDAVDLPGDAPPTLAEAIQEQLGLKLDARKGPIDLLVIDSANKSPIEN